MLALYCCGATARADVAVIGQARVKLGKGSWQAVLTRDGAAPDYQVLLVLRGPKGERTVVRIDARADEAGGRFRPFLGTMRLMGRELLLLRLPSESAGTRDSLVRIQLYDLKAGGDVEKVLDAAAYSNAASRDCGYRVAVRLESAGGNGERVRLIHEEKGGAKRGPGVCADRRATAEFEWKKGCYARSEEKASAEFPVTAFMGYCRRDVGLVPVGLDSGKGASVDGKAQARPTQVYEMPVEEPPAADGGIE